MKMHIYSGEQKGFENRKRTSKQIEKKTVKMISRKNQITTVGIFARLELKVKFYILNFCAVLAGHDNRH